MDEWKPSIIISIDFGTTHTAVCWSKEPEWSYPQQIQRWPRPPGESLGQLDNKVPTVVGYDADGDLANWGFVTGADGTAVTIEDRFKPYIDPTFSDNYDNKPTHEQALRFYQDFMTSLCHYIEIFFKNMMIDFDKKNVEFLFSIPTKWKNPTITANLERILAVCGYSGHHRRLKIQLTEAEAVAINAAKETGHVGDIIMVVDAGGMTTNIDIVRIVEQSDRITRLEGLATAEGINVGSTLINDDVRRWIRYCLIKLGAGARDGTAALTRTADDMLREGLFERIKCMFEGERYGVDRNIMFTIPQGVAPLVRDREIVVLHTEIKDAFDQQIRIMADKIREQILKLPQNHPNARLSSLMLSGGLGSSLYVLQKLRAIFFDIKVFCVNNPYLAVAKGLVMDRVQKLKDNVGIYGVRRSRVSYGVLCRLPFDRTLHQGERIVVDSPGGMVWACEQIDWLVKKSEVVDEGGFERKHRMLLPKDTYAKTFEAQYVMSDRSAHRLPSSLAKGNVGRLCVVKATFKNKENSRRGLRSIFMSRPHDIIDFKIRVIVETTNIRFMITSLDGLPFYQDTASVAVEWGEPTAPTEPPPLRFPRIFLPSFPVLRELEPSRDMTNSVANSHKGAVPLPHLSSHLDTNQAVSDRRSLPSFPDASSGGSDTHGAIDLYQQPVADLEQSLYKTSMPAAAKQWQNVTAPRDPPTYEELEAEAISRVASSVVGLLLRDKGLVMLYAEAFKSFSPREFHHQHDRLLKEFLEDLKNETQSADRLKVIDVLQHRQTLFEIAIIVRILVPLRNIAGKFSRLALKPYSAQDLVAAFRAKESSAVDGVESDADTNADHRIHKLEQSNIKDLKEYLTYGPAFKRFKLMLSCLLDPPNNLSKALESRNVQIVESYLVNNFDTAASGGFEWLKELADTNYTKREIAQLLLDEISESPWIHFQGDRDQSEINVQIDHHVNDCVHTYKPEVPKTVTQLSETMVRSPPPSRTDVQYRLQALCGIGGVIPRSRDHGVPLNCVQFDTGFSTCRITFKPPSTQGQPALISQLAIVLQDLCIAMTMLQSTELCCNSFTVLIKRPGFDHLILCQIRFRDVLKLAHIFHSWDADYDSRTEEEYLINANLYAHSILSSTRDSSAEFSLHYCALAVQFVCVGFVAYTQAHIGAIDPFFLDTPLSRIILQGTGEGSSLLSIVAELVELNCLGEMTQQKVIAFQAHAAHDVVIPIENYGRRYNVKASIPDLIDTWGPAHYIVDSMASGLIKAIVLGGGYLYSSGQPDTRHHWSKSLPSDFADRRPFGFNDILEIASLVKVNGNCRIDELAVRRLFYGALHPIGTYQNSWQLQQRQAGISGGQYITGSYIHVYDKKPGVTHKQKLLRREAWQLIYDLDHSWGLQVSICTSIARRVPLRHLIADLLSTFVNPLEQVIWQELVTKHDIIDVFQNKDIFECLRQMSGTLQSYVLELMKGILMQLENTGFDSSNSTAPFLTVAWPCKGDVQRGLRLPCKGKTYWAQILADAEDCATFAYMTPKCLETNLEKCCGDGRQWENSSKFLITEVSPNDTETSLSLSQQSSAGASMTSSGLSASTWTLDQKVYYVKKMDALLHVKVDRIPKSVEAHLVVSESKIPTGIWKRMFATQKGRHYIRERQAAGDHSEGVVVRSSAMY